MMDQMNDQPQHHCKNKTKLPFPLTLPLSCWSRGKCWENHARPNITGQSQIQRSSEGRTGSRYHAEYQRCDRNGSRKDCNLCVQVLIDWINSELEEDRIIVKDLEEDCYDGQVLQKLFGEKLPFGAFIYPPTWAQAPGGFLECGSSPVIKLIMSSLFLTEKLSGRKLNVAEVTQSEIGQKQKLQTVLEAVNELLRPHGWTIEWSVDCERAVAEYFTSYPHWTWLLPPVFRKTPTWLWSPDTFLICHHSYPFKEPGGHRVSAGRPGDALPGTHQAARARVCAGSGSQGKAIWLVFQTARREYEIVLEWFFIKNTFVFLFHPLVQSAIHILFVSPQKREGILQTALVTKELTSTTE